MAGFANSETYPNCRTLSRELLALVQDRQSRLDHSRSHQQDPMAVVFWMQITESLAMLPLSDFSCLPCKLMVFFSMFLLFLTGQGLISKSTTCRTSLKGVSWFVTVLHGAVSRGHGHGNDKRLRNMKPTKRMTGQWLCFGKASNS